MATAKRRSRYVIKLLIVDDSALIRKLLADVFASVADVTIAFARTGAEALVKIADFDPDVVTLDVNMPEMDGLTCLDRIMLEHPRPVVMLSSLTRAGADASIEAMRLGAVDVVAKPSGPVSLEIDAFGPMLIEIVRHAASANVASTRLRERVRRQTSSVITVLRAQAVATNPKSVARKAPVTRLSGEGVVVVGVSTGGPPALETILTGLDVRFGWPVVIAQHMPATFTGALARRLDKLCPLNVVEVDKVTPLLAGHVYIARGSADIVIAPRPAGPVAMPAPAKAGYLWQPSVDRLVRSAMGAYASAQIIGVMLTGMGNDGANAMTALHAAGGRVVAESEDSAVVWGMPGELVRAGGADWVAHIDDIASILSRLAPCR